MFKKAHFCISLIFKKLIKTMKLQTHPFLPRLFLTVTNKKKMEDMEFCIIRNINNN